MNKPVLPVQPVKPWTPEQFKEMEKLRDEILPSLKDMLARNKRAGMDTTQLEESIKRGEQQLIGMIDAWKDVYP